MQAPLDLKYVALVGTPNSGKSSLFNLLTGSRQRVGNYPGVTVEKKVGLLQLGKGQKIELIDLPGTYSLEPQSIDEQITCDVLNHGGALNKIPDAVIAVADATNLERTLALVLEIRAKNIPVIVALNMMDLALSRGVDIDIKVLEQQLGLPVATTTAVSRHGVEPLLNVIEKRFENLQKRHAEAKFSQGLDISNPEARFQEVDRILQQALRAPASSHLWTQRLDRVFLHPVLGPIVLIGLLMTLFQSVFSWAEAPMELIETGVSGLSDLVRLALGAGLLTDLITDGAIAGVGAVIVFLPQILILFLFIYLLESSGYMMRAAFILDRLMARVGLQGRSFVPLLSSFACAIPGVMAARSIREPRERLITILIAPLMTCSARLPVYVLLIGAFVPHRELGLGLGLQGLVMFGLFAVAVMSAMLVAWVLRFTTFKGPNAMCLIEMPTYKLPVLGQLVINLWMRTKAFCKRAGTIILAVSVSLWVLSTFPRAPLDYPEPAINYSLAGRIGHAIEPLVAPIGFDWRIATGLVPGFAAREVMVSALGTVFAVENADDEGAGTLSLQQHLTATWSLGTGLALLAWYVFAPQCLATIAVVRRETNSWLWAGVLFGYMLFLAYIAAFVVHSIFS
jgi:ferrous iron transport protein B